MWDPSTDEGDFHKSQSRRIAALCERDIVSRPGSNQVLRGGRLWIDNYGGASEIKLRTRSITAVCALGGPEAGYEPVPEDVAYLSIVVDDYHYVDIRAHFDAATDFIHSEMQKPGGRVLVHCAAGVSRSATICMAYLMRFHHLSFRAAYAVVLDARSIVDPNPGFITQLQQYEEELNLQ